MGKNNAFVGGNSKYFKFISFYFFICMTVNHSKSSRNYVLEFLESLNTCVCVCVCRISSLAYPSVQFSSVAQSWLFATPWIAAHQASLSITNSWSWLKLMSIELVMPSSHLIFCRPLLLLTPNPSQHQGLFQWVNSSHEVAKVLLILSWL